jgi:acyl-CoA oxidase
MLAAHAQLATDGTYSKSPLRSKLSYSVMLLVRSRMPGIFAVQLAQATTIATR